MPSPPLNRLFLAAMLFLLAAPALAQWLDDTPYTKIAKMGLILNKVDPEKIYVVRYQVKAAKGHTVATKDVKFQIRVSGQEVPVPIQADGRFDLPARQDWAENDAILQSNQPDGSIVVALSIDSRTPPGTRMSYAQLTESVPVMEEGIKEMAGMMSFMAPRVRQLVLNFDKARPQTVILTLPGGKRKLWKSDAKGRATVPWEPGWLAATVELSAPLVSIDRVLK